MLNNTYLSSCRSSLLPPLLPALCICTLLGAPMQVAAEALVRSTQAIEQLPVQSVTLAMTPRAAFEHLRAAGFQAGNLTAYTDWDTDGIEFVRGTYGSPDGYSSVSFTRRGERLVTLGETFNSPGNPIDAVSAINRLRQQLSIDEDAARCRTRGAHNGFCEVYDAQSNTEVTIRYTLQIMTSMRMVAVSRPQELASH